MKLNLSLLSFAFFILHLFTVRSQDFFPPISNYTSEQYSHEFSPDNHGITQDNLGIMYFGNTGHILSFDGTKWLSIEVVPARVTRSLYTSKKGIIYAGAMGDFGRLLIDSTGSYYYQSLVDSLLRADYPFTDIWTILETPKGIFFHSQEQIFRFHDERVSAIPMPSTAHTVFAVNGELVARMRDIGLMRWSGEEWIKITGSEDFEIYAAFGIVPLSNSNDHLIITQEIGMYRLKSNWKVEKIESENNEYLNKLLIFGAKKISKNKIALQTFDKGSVIISENGTEIGRINKRMGLKSNEVKNQFVDIDGNLWLSLGNGLALVNLHSRLSYFGENQGLIGGVKSVIETEHNGESSLYVGTHEGLFRINQENQSLDKIYEKITEIPYTVWSLKQIGKMLFIGTSEGLYRLNLEQKSAKPERLNRQNINALYYEKEKDFLIMAGSQGLQVINPTSQKILYTYKASFSTVTNIEKQKYKNKLFYWTGLHSQGLLKLIYSDGTFSVDFFSGESYGFPDDHILVPQKIGNKVLLGTTVGILGVEHVEVDDEVHTVFMPENVGDSTFSKALFYLTEDKNHIWYCLDNDVGVYDKREKTYINRPFWGIKKGRVNVLYKPEKSNYLWIGATEGLIRYDIKGDIPYKEEFNTLIRKVETKEGKLVFGGYPNNKLPKATLEYEKNLIQFSFSAPYFEDHQPIEYSYHLKGYNDKWSEWSEKTEVEFSNLPEGDYEFIVKARNVYRQEAEPAKFSFTILTPWYRSTAAYTAYVLVFLIILFVVVRISIYQLKRQNKRLELAVKERTKEIEEKNHRLEDQKSKILQQKTEIEDSINYAQRIQEAILPIKSEMKKHLDDSFIMFWPKDVVSGDFYWFHQLGSKSIVVCADCTGHGVPGAFMSMIGVDKLNVCVGEKGITSPDKILAFLNEGIKQSLRQDSGKKATRDGMDAAIITIDHSTGKVEYSGANRPLWYVQGGELFEIKATKVAVGGFTPIDQVYDLNELIISETTHFYMSTDGYADQFGGPKNKKFKVKAMKELIIEHYEKPMEEQKVIFEDEMTKWKEGYDQVDDICFMGVLIRK
ncbi:MAG: triple tyrosine motif-containing protein [Brumimicrobium sp.]|nr:triple tyrosine motif-containing protein [Brumimicrobium sp.]